MRDAVALATIFATLGEARFLFPRMVQECGPSSPVSEFENLEWALLIDGKDAQKGCNAYGHGFWPAFDALDLALQRFGNLELNLTLVEQLMCCGTYRGDKVVPLADFAPDCFRSMSCKTKKDIFADVLPELIHITSSENCPAEIALPAHPTAKNTLRDILDNYNVDMRKAMENSFDSWQEIVEGKILILTRFLRNLAWLHPLKNGNGRLRTILLQHEVRRCGLGRGAAMFNNNRDVFFINSSTYAAKIKEGIHMADKMFAEKQNPWLNKTNVEAHIRMFPTPSSTCHEGGGWGSVLSSKDTISP